MYYHNIRECLVVWQAACNKISYVNVRLPHVDVRFSDIAVIAKMSTWNLDDNRSSDVDVKKRIPTETVT